MLSLKKAGTLLTGALLAVLPGCENRKVSLKELEGPSREFDVKAQGQLSYKAPVDAVAVNNSAENSFRRTGECGTLSGSTLPKTSVRLQSSAETVGAVAEGLVKLGQELASRHMLITSLEEVAELMRQQTFSFQVSKPSGLAPLEPNPDGLRLEMPVKEPIYQDPRLSKNPLDRLNALIEDLRAGKM